LEEQQETLDDLHLVTIPGELVHLGPIGRSMIPLFQRWINALDVQVRLGMDLPGPFTIEEQERWYDAVTSSATSRTFAIWDVGADQEVGTTSLQKIDWRNGSAEFGAMVGDPQARGKGIGTECARLMLDYGFTVLGLHSISLVVAEFNLAGRQAYARAGFCEIGRLREHWLIGGRRWDVVLMDCLRTDFQSEVLSSVLDLPSD
jgi:RimJ/RimL family protein N-acetyltransferase